MRITPALKAHLVSLKKISAKASPAAVKAVALKMVASGELTPAKLEQLTKAAPVAGKSALERVVQDAVKGALKPTKTAPAPTPKNDATPPYLKRLSAGNVRQEGTQGNGSAASFMVRSANGLRVKAPSEMYRKDRAVGLHRSTGQPVIFQGRPVEHSSEQMLAKMGAFLRWKVARSPLGMQIRPLDDHEKALVEEMFAHEDFWAVRGDDHVLVKGMEIKANLLNDSTSGGQEIVPYWFDEIPILFPLLHSEILPNVTIRDVPRGNSTEGGSIGNPTVSWGTAEGTNLTLFDATALVADFSTTIYPMTFAMKIGIDFLSDSPMQVGQELQNNIGQSVLKELDNVIVNGSGSSRPTGLFNASGTNLIAAAGGGAVSVADAENLVFGMGKQYRAQNWNPCFVMRDQDYARFRAVPVAPADQRRVFGMDHQSYQLLQYPVKIQNDITAGNAAFVALLKYILYRRKGWDLRTVTEGYSLALSNEIAFIGRGRFGGKLSDGAAMSEMNDLPTT